MLGGINHFLSPGFYQQMMPPWIPEHELMIALSGLAEIALGALLLYPPTRRLGALGVILLLIAAIPAYLLMAGIPLQLVLMGWAALYLRGHYNYSNE